jgi:hypothetical protein
MSAKMDGVNPRTPSQLQEMLGLGKRFAEVIGLATDARDTADEAKKAVENLDGDLTSEEIYNRLTNNGEAQGLFRDENGNLYVNGEYIYALEKLFAKDINMSGKFTHTAEVFLEATEAVVETIQKHILGTEIIPIDKFPLYDFNNDGDITLVDMAMAKMSSLGLDTLADWSGAVKTPVTMTIDLSNPEKMIRITGKNMWGGDIDQYIGVNFTNIKNADVEKKLNDLSNDYIVESGRVDGWYYEKWNSGLAKCSGFFRYDIPHISTANGNIYVSIDIPLNNYPFEFKDVPCVNVFGGAVYGGFSWLVCDYEQNLQSKTRPPEVTVARSTALNGANYAEINISAVGYWK